MNTTNTTWDDVLVALMEENPQPDYQTLLAWHARYPRFADDLTEHFAIWAEQEALTTSVVLDEPRLRNQAVSLALQHAHAMSANAPTQPKALTHRLEDAIRAHGFKDSTLARQCRLDETMVVKLDRRRIQPWEDIPLDCFRMIGEALNEPGLRVKEMICGPPLVASPGGLRKARTKAVVTTETFEQAIRSSTLSDPDKAFWLALAKAQVKRG
jgi:hypothetical protein